MGTVVYLALLWSRSIREIKLGETTLIVNGERRESSDPIVRAADNVALHVSGIAAMLCGRYYRLVKRKGVKERYITEVPDSRDVRMLLLLTVTRGNGSASVQKIIEGEIVREAWRGRDLREYVESVVVPRITGAVREMINAEYDSHVLLEPGRFRDRIVSQVEWYNDLVSMECQKELASMVLPYFEFARECVDSGCKG